MENIICKSFDGTEFKYDKITNELWRKFRGLYWRNVKLTPDKDGYCRIVINKKWYLFHRIIMMMCNDDFNIFDLNQVIDHRDRKPLNNHIDNLNIVTIKQNLQNKNVKGYTYNKGSNRWRAYISIDGKRKTYSFKSENEAIDKRAELVGDNYYQG